MFELGSGASVNEICMARFSRMGFAFFLRGCRIVFLRFFFLPGTLIFLVMNLNLYWRRSCLPRAPKPADPPLAQASWVCTLIGPSLRAPRREFFLLRSCAIWPKFQVELSCGTRPVRFPAPIGLPAAAAATPRFHALILGKAFLNLSVHGGRAGSVSRPAFQSPSSKSVRSAKTFGSSIP